MGAVFRRLRSLGGSRKCADVAGVGFPAWWVPAMVLTRSRPRGLSTHTQEPRARPPVAGTQRLIGSTAMIAWPDTTIGIWERTYGNRRRRRWRPGMSTRPQRQSRLHGRGCGRMIYREGRQGVQSHPSQLIRRRRRRPAGVKSPRVSLHREWRTTSSSPRTKSGASRTAKPSRALRTLCRWCR